MLVSGVQQCITVVLSSVYQQINKFFSIGVLCHKVLKVIIEEDEFLQALL